MKEKITVETTVQAPVEKVWAFWTEPEHIMQWCSASSDWGVPRATNDLTVGGKFLTRMEAKDGSVGFDFEGTYTTVVQNERIEYVMPDGRTVQISFEIADSAIKITETFDPENQNPIEMQKGGWQAILDSFKKHVEAQ